MDEVPRERISGEIASMPFLSCRLGELDPVVAVGDGRPAVLVSLGCTAPSSGQLEEVWKRPGLQALAELSVDGENPLVGHRRLGASAIGERLRFVEQDVVADDRWTCWRIMQRDPLTGLRVTTVLRGAAGLRTLHAWTEVHNPGNASRLLQAVASIAVPVADLLAPDIRPPLSAWELQRADTGWIAESRWRRGSLADFGLVDVNPRAHGTTSRLQIAAVSTSTFSTGQVLPMGVLAGEAGAIAWQVEHNGPWTWQLEEAEGGGLGLLAVGPTDREHSWSELLVPGGTFRSVPATLAVGDGVDDAISALTAHRRAVRTPHADLVRPSVVYNDYLNTVMADPSSAKLEPLIERAAELGAEVFCIDSGWFAPAGDVGWDSMGEWLPSSDRFADGLDALLDRIREFGMVAGLWLEPEMVGHTSPAARSLPDEAFLRRNGRRVFDGRRFHLDMAHPAAHAHLDAVVDRLVADLGVGYLKLDYNSEPGAGSDHPVSPGAALLAHSRGLVAWLRGVRARHPHLLIENCASGGLRADQALMPHVALQSTSDQQDMLRVPPIAASAPRHLPPEQAGSWVCLNAGYDDDLLDLVLTNGLLGRSILSGWIDRLSAAQAARVRDAIVLQKSIREDVARAAPIWPIGLPGWDDDWIALGLRVPERLVTYVSVWRRGTSSTLRMPMAGSAAPSVLLHPGATTWTATREGDEIVVRTAAGGPSGTLIAVPD